MCCGVARSERCGIFVPINLPYVCENEGRHTGRLLNSIGGADDDMHFLLFFRFLRKDREHGDDERADQMHRIRDPAGTQEFLWCL